MSRYLGIFAAALVAVLLIAAFLCTYIVTEREQAIVFTFGDPQRVVQDPGLYFKKPWDSVEYYDSRVLDYDVESQEVIASDQKRLVVDTFVRYRITDPLLFYQTVTTETSMEDRLSSFINAAMRSVLGEVTLETVLTEERAVLMQRITELVSDRTESFGIKVLDVRIKRADLPEANSQAIYEQMQSQRQQEAKLIRAEGLEAAQRIRARADRQQVEILSDARRQSEILRGEGDAKAIDIYANAFSRDPDFYSFYRTMQAYRNSLTSEDSTFVLSPDSDFFRYLKNLQGREAPQ
jgi:membrane protease subunit HflC